MSASLERARVELRRSLTVGAGRNPIDVPDWLKAEKDSGSDLLSLVAALGLRSRFDRPAAPDRWMTMDVSHDPAQMLDEPSRATLRRLYRAKPQMPETAVTLRILDALASRHLCLHPFDYHSLLLMMAVDQTALDANASDWLRRRRGDDTDAPPYEIGAENWTDFPPAMRADFLRRLRRSDAARARELCADAIANDTAAVRGKLVQALFVGLGDDDVDFLRSVAADRAASVKRVAASLLARIDGTEEHRERLENAHRFLTVKSGGVIGRRKIIEPAVPKGTAKSKIGEWLAITFGDVNPAQVAQALELTPKQFADALGDSALRGMFFLGAVDAGEQALATRIAAGFDVNEAYSQVHWHRERFAAMDPQARGQLWSCFDKTLASEPLQQSSHLLALLYEALRLPPPAATFDALATPRRWRQWVKAADGDVEPGDARVPELLISLCPGEQRNAWRERLAALSPGWRANATALADLFDAVDAHPSASAP